MDGSRQDDCPDRGSSPPPSPLSTVQGSLQSSSELFVSPSSLTDTFPSLESSSPGTNLPSTESLSTVVQPESSTVTGSEDEEGNARRTALVAVPSLPPFLLLPPPAPPPPPPPPLPMVPPIRMDTVEDVAGDVGLNPSRDNLNKTSSTPDEKRGPRPMTAPAGPVSETDPEAAPRAVQALLDLPCSSKQADPIAEAQRALSAGVAEDRARNREDAFAEYLRAHAKEGLRHRFSGSQRIAASKFTIVRSKVSCTSSSTLDEESDYRDADAEQSGDDDDDDDDDVEDVTQPIDLDASFNYIFPPDDADVTMDPAEWTTDTTTTTTDGRTAARANVVSVAAATQVDAAAVSQAPPTRPLSAAASAPNASNPTNSSSSNNASNATAFSGGLVLLYYRPHGSYASAVDVRYPPLVLTATRPRSSLSAPPSPTVSLSTRPSSPLVTNPVYALRASPPVPDLAPATSTSQTQLSHSGSHTISGAATEPPAPTIPLLDAWKSTRIVSPPIPVPAPNKSGAVAEGAVGAATTPTAGAQPFMSPVSWSLMTLAPAVLRLGQTPGVMTPKASRKTTSTTLGAKVTEEEAVVVVTAAKSSALPHGNRHPKFSVSKSEPEEAGTPTDHGSNWSFNAGSGVTLVPNPLSVLPQSSNKSIPSYEEPQPASSAVKEAKATIDALVDTVLAADKEVQEVATSTNSVPPCSRPEVILAETEPEDDLDAVEEVPEAEALESNTASNAAEMTVPNSEMQLLLSRCTQDASVQTSPSPSVAAMRMRRFLRGLRRFTRAVLCLPPVPQSTATK